MPEIVISAEKKEVSKKEAQTLPLELMVHWRT